MVVVSTLNEMNGRWPRRGTRDSPLAPSRVLAGTTRRSPVSHWRQAQRGLGGDRVGGEQDGGGEDCGAVGHGQQDVERDRSGHGSDCELAGVDCDARGRGRPRSGRAGARAPVALPLVPARCRAVTPLDALKSTGATTPSGRCRPRRSRRRWAAATAWSCCRPAAARAYASRSRRRAATGWWWWCRR